MRYNHAILLASKSLVSSSEAEILPIVDSAGDKLTEPGPLPSRQLMAVKASRAWCDTMLNGFLFEGRQDFWEGLARDYAHRDSEGGPKDSFLSLRQIADCRLVDPQYFNGAQSALSWVHSSYYEVLCENYAHQGLHSKPIPAEELTPNVRMTIAQHLMTELVGPFSRDELSVRRAIASRAYGSSKKWSAMAALALEQMGRATYKPEDMAVLVHGLATLTSEGCNRIDWAYLQEQLPDRTVRGLQRHIWRNADFYNDSVLELVGAEIPFVTKRDWDVAEEEIIIAAVMNHNHDPKALATQLGRSRHAVNHRVQLLREQGRLPSLGSA